MMKRYRLTPEAARDLDEITNFLTGGNPRAAIRLIDDIEKKCQALAEMPGIGRSREELAPNLRSSLAGKYLIFYRPSTEGVEIIRVIHGARDIPKLFERGRGRPPVRALREVRAWTPSPTIRSRGIHWIRPT